MYSWEFAGRGRGGPPFPGGGSDEPLLDENGQPLLDENGNILYPEH